MTISVHKKRRPFFDQITRGGRKIRKFITDKIFMFPVIEKLLWIVACLAFLPFHFAFTVAFHFHLEKKNILLHTTERAERVTLDNVHTLYHHAMKIVFLLFPLLP